MDTLDPGIRRLCSTLLDFGAGTDVTERRANPLQPALGARMTFVARPHTPSKYYYYNNRFDTTISFDAKDALGGFDSKDAMGGLDLIQRQLGGGSSRWPRCLKGGNLPGVL